MEAGVPARLFLATRNTLNMLWNSTKVAVSDRDRDEELAKAADACTPRRFDIAADAAIGHELRTAVTRREV
jgi:hypothetical protein